MKKLILRDGALHFAERSCLPMSAVCLVAASMRDRLTSLFGVPVTLCVLEPEIPDSSAWQTIAAGTTHVYRVRGNVAEAAILLRNCDAEALVATAFGEASGSRAIDMRLSPLEREVLDRVVTSLLGTLVTLCGEQREPAASSSALGEFVVYLELVVEQPVSARLGVALSRDVVPQPVPALGPDDLAHLPLEASVAFELQNLTAQRVAALVPGDVVPITRPGTLRGSLRIGGRTLAVGTCGVRDGRYALEIEGCVA